MTRQQNYNQHTYWVTVEPAIVETTGKTVFIAYVSDEEPGGFFYGQMVRDGEGKPLLFGDELTARTNANVIKQSELDR